jgi:prepilin-type N-terminal cleavage/methylation domain-containing protein
MKQASQGTKRNKQQGFTLIELAIVLAIAALLAATFLPGLLKNRDDAQYTSALTQLQKDFPSAITRQLARTNQCNATTMTRTNLLTRGLPANTVWGTAWSATYASNRVSVVYPLTNADDPATAGADLVSALSSSSNVAAVSVSGTNLTVQYRCN